MSRSGELVGVVAETVVARAVREKLQLPAEHHGAGSIRAGERHRTCRHDGWRDAGEIGRAGLESTAAARDDDDGDEQRCGADHAGEPIRPSCHRARSMRLLHTSDWHLGHTLKEVTREHEHAAFLAGCAKRARARHRMWSWSRATCSTARRHRRAPKRCGSSGSPRCGGRDRRWISLRSLAITIRRRGSARRPCGVARARRARRRQLAAPCDGALDHDRILVPVAGGRGVVAAVPFLRPIDIDPDAPDPLAAIYAEVLEQARAAARAGSGADRARSSIYDGRGSVRS